MVLPHADRQRAVQPQANGLVPIVADRTQPLGLRVGRIIERGGVLQGQHHGVVLHAAHRRLGVRRQQRLRVDRVVVQEAVGRLGLAPAPASLREGRGRSFAQLSHDKVRTLEQT